MLDGAQSERLIHLWNDRGELQSEAEWAELYRLVGRILMTCNAPILASLRDTREYYIQDFIVKKVFETAGRNATPLERPGALCTFFRNYLIDRQRNQAPEDTLSPRDGEDDAVPLIEQFGFVPAEDGLNPTSDGVACGVALEQARQSAREFLLTLMGWQRTLLARKFCADRDEARTAYQLARELGAASPAYHLEKLGVTKHHGGGGNPDFCNTKLGTWITSLGVEPIRENAACMLWLFAQLCHEALAMDQEEER